MNQLKMSLSRLAILGPLLLSCAPAVAPTPTPKPEAVAPTAKPGAATPTPKPATEKPRYGGTLTIAYNNDPASFDIHQESSGAMLMVVSCAYNGLLQYSTIDPEKTVGDLAERWETSPDGKAYTFYLRKGIKWHDGTAFTAEDVQFSFDRVRKPPVGTRSPRSSMLKGISRIDTPDKDTVRIELASPSAGFFETNVVTAWHQIMPKHVIEARGHMKDVVVGTGPFRLKSYANNVSYEFVRNQDYFIRGRPYLDGVAFYIIRDLASRFAAFRTHRVRRTTLANGLTPAQAELVQKTMPDAMAGQSPGSNWLSLIMNNEKAPWNDTRVRRAVNLAIDRQQAIKVVDEGWGQVGLYMPPGRWATPEAEISKMPGFRQPKDADRAEAKKLLAEAGYPSGLKTSLLVRSGAYYENAAVFMKDQLATIGIQADIDIREYVDVFDRMSRHDYAMTYFKDALDTMDPTAILSDRYRSGAGRNYAAFSDKTVDELLDKQDATLDEPKRKEIVLQVQERMLELQPQAVTHWGSYLMGWWKEVRGFNPAVPIYSNSKHEQVWLATQ